VDDFDVASGLTVFFANLIRGEEACIDQFSEDVFGRFTGGDKPRPNVPYYGCLPLRRGGVFLNDPPTRAESTDSPKA
jgi:hypothetical protein